jgi:protocadherin Fat 4
MSKVEQSSEKASAAKKNKVDTDNLDLGGETPIERMDIVLPGQDDIGQGVGHINQQPLEGGVGTQASPQSHVNAPTEQDFAFNNASDANTPDINAPASTNNANQGRNAQIQDVPSIDGVDAVQSASAAPLAPELNSLSQENRAEGADGQLGPSSISQTTTGSEDASEINVAPVDIDFSNTEVAENASGGTVIATLSTVDANDTDTHTYEIVSDPSGYFEIVGDEIRVKDGADLDFETAPIHEIAIQVTDSSGNTFTETMTIDLTDVNEYDVSSISDTDTSTNTIAEDVSNGDSVGITASATDADGSNNTVSYSLSDDAGGIFEIDASTGEVSIADASSIDYESATSHTIEVTATSADGSTSTQSYTIDVSDVDEFDVGAVTDTDTSANTIAEDVSNGDSVGITASATDADGSNNTVTYSLSVDAGGIFEIDANTGEVSIADASGIDYENATSHTIEVTATSADGSTSTQSYAIDVTDVDEFDVGAVSDTDSNANTLAENASAGDEIGVTASATDADGTNNTVTYSVDDARFEVASDGAVTVASGASFDAETEGSIDIEVTATSADGSTSTETFSINVSDIDEFDVGAVSDSNASSNAADEDASVGDTVGITALASDGDVTDGVTYSLSDDAGGLFDIDANTGVVTVAGSLDAETSTSHTIEVTATSDDGSTSTQTFAIGVNDVNETSITAISDTDGTGNTVTEGASVGTAVGITAFASDADATDTVSYSLSSNPGGFFAIDASTGEVTVAGSLDYETDTAHTIEVTATSTDGTTSTQTFTIAVGDEDEHDVSSISDTDTSTNTISEDVSNGDSVGITASATDADGSNNTVTYSLSNDAGGIFEIDANTGEVSIADASGIDYETATSHTIEVTATSADGSTSTQSYTIDVSDVDEFDVSAVSDTDSAANSIAEDVSNGDSVGITASATDADGSNNTVTYSLSDDAGGIFEIDANTGEVSILDASGIDYENATSHTIEVTATSADGSTSTQSYTINVTDVDEFDVGAVTDTDSNANTIAENASAGNEIGVTASATDADGTNNAVTYSVDDARFEVASDGTVTVATGASFDAETEGSIDIAVTATSADGSTSTETFSINISDIDEFDVGAVSDSNTATNGVDENASVGDTVGITALASDGDVVNFR